MRKSFFILVLVAGFAAQLEAQEANKFRLDLGLGYAIPSSGGGGVLFNFEPKWTLNEKMNVGIRLGVAAYGRDLGSFSNNTIEVGANASYIGTYDYYFHNGTSSFAPFVGGGAGFYQVASASIGNSNTIGADGKLGGMLRAGFDVGKFRVAAEYNFIGKSDVIDLNNQVLGTAENGYFGISIGAYFGGGKWGK